MLGIDTDSQIGAFGLERVFARGRCSDQFDELERLVPPGPAPDEIRVLLMHHSPILTGLVGGLSSTSRARTREFVRTREIRVVLCGHTHRDAISCIDPASPDVLVACSGATTQRTELPLQLPAPLRQGRRTTGQANSLVLHQIEADGPNLFWRARVCHADQVDGFRVVPGPLMEGRVRV